MSVVPIIAARMRWPRLLSECEAAEYLSIGTTTLREKGPAPKVLGRRRLYDIKDLDRWADRLGGQPLDRMADDLIAALGGRVDDDVAVLAARLPGCQAGLR